MIAALLLALAASTGPSSATYRLVPVAASAGGAVIFRTWRELNPIGAHAPQRVEVGWLAVSAAGIWREAPEALVDPAELGDDAAGPRIAALAASLEAPLDTERPPAGLRPLLAELGVGPLRRVDPLEGAGAAVWTPARTCARGRCERALVQRTIGGLESDPGAGSPVRSSFLLGGVALFHGGVDEEGTATGARFTLPPNVREEPGLGPVDFGYDMVGVDGIVVLGARVPARTLPVRIRAGTALEDAASPTAARARLAASIPAGERVRLMKEGRAAHPATCAEFLRAVARGYEAATTTVELHAAGNRLVRCAGLELVSRLHPSRETHVREPVFGPAALAELPPCLGGMNASQEAHAAARRASDERVTWNLFDPAARATDTSPTALVVRDADSETAVEVLAWGDLDGDGREDVLVASTVQATSGSWTRTGVYVLGRRAGDPLLRVLAERSLFAARTCVGP